MEIISYNREKDREMRKLTLESMKIALKHNFVDLAMKLGKTSQNLAHKIKNFNYQQADDQTSKINDSIRTTKKL